MFLQFWITLNKGSTHTLLYRHKLIFQAQTHSGSLATTRKPPGQPHNIFAKCFTILSLKFVMNWFSHNAFSLIQFCLSHIILGFSPSFSSSLSPSFFSSLFPILFCLSLIRLVFSLSFSSISPPHSFLLSTRFSSVSPSFFWAPLICSFVSQLFCLSLIRFSLSLPHYHLPLPHSFLILIVFAFSHSPILSQYHFSYRSFFSFRYWLLSPSIPLCLAHVNLSISLTLVSAPSSYSLFSRILDGR